MIYYKVIQVAVWAVLSSRLVPIHNNRPINVEAKARQDEVARQYTRFHSLMKEGKLDEAESALNGLVGYRSNDDLGRDRAEVFLARNDYDNAFRELKLYFEGQPGEKRFVSGAEDTRVWYWFLLVQHGDDKKAATVQAALLHDKVRSPMGRTFLEPEKLTHSNSAQVYMYMAGYYSRTGNYYRSDAYIELAKQADPDVIVDPNFEKIAVMYGYQKGVKGRREADELMPMLDHGAYQKNTGQRVRFL